MKSVGSAALAVSILISLVACGRIDDEQTDDQILQQFRTNFPRACAEEPSPGIAPQNLLQLCECIGNEMANTFSVETLKRMAKHHIETETEKSQVAAINRRCAASLDIKIRP